MEEASRYIFYSNDEKKKEEITGEFPRVEFVEVNLSNNGDRKRGRLDFSPQIVNH